MTESRWPKLELEHDQKIFRMTNLKNWTWLKFKTTTNINFTPKNMLVHSAWTGPLAPAHKLTLARTPDQPRSPFALLLYEKKISGTEVRRTPDARLRFVGFNFGHIHLVILNRSGEYSSLITLSMFQSIFWNQLLFARIIQA